jgi:hypothetical protein
MNEKSDLFNTLCINRFASTITGHDKSFLTLCCRWVKCFRRFEEWWRLRHQEEAVLELWLLDTIIFRNVGKLPIHRHGEICQIWLFSNTAVCHLMQCTTWISLWYVKLQSMHTENTASCLLYDMGGKAFQTCSLQFCFKMVQLTENYTRNETRVSTWGSSKIFVSCLLRELRCRCA